MASLIPRRAFPLRSSFICSSCLNRAPTRRYQSTEAAAVADAETDLPQSTTFTSLPAPTPFVPDVNTFLTLIGRELPQHASKFATWEEMFTLTSRQLKTRGLEPTRTRRYFLRWREKFQRAEYGIGGDLQHVKDGIAELRVCEVPSLPRTDSAQAGTTQPASGAEQAEQGPSTRPFASTSHTPGKTRLILNVPHGQTTYKLAKGENSSQLKKPAGMKLKEGHIIVGKYVIPIPGTNGMGARIKVTPGMWEDKRGHKVHGGERRRKEMIHKEKVAENKKASR